MYLIILGLSAANGRIPLPNGFLELKLVLVRKGHLAQYSYFLYKCSTEQSGHSAGFGPKRRTEKIRFRQLEP